MVKLKILILFLMIGLNLKSQDLESLRINPKKDFEFNSLIKSQNDTLEIVTCADYVLFPFGRFDNIDQIKAGLLSGFKIKSQRTDDSVYFYYDLVQTSNRLLISIDKDSEASAHSNIVNGLIIESNVKTINNITIGMTIDTFLDLHFKSYPTETKVKFKTIIFDYCVQGIKHIYKFDNSKLISIEYK